MTKSKIFILGALLVVATCGVFATKAVNKLVPTTVWYINSQEVCTTTVLEIPPCTTEELEFDCKRNLPVVGLTTIFETTDQQGKCIDPYKTDLP